MRTRIACETGILTTVAIALLPFAARAATITGGLSPGDFVNPTIEKFQGPEQTTTSYDFGNGMTHLNLNGQSDLINRTGGYGMGDEPSISNGKDGPGDGYFGTGSTPTTFQFAFAGGVGTFGFFGAESSVQGGSAGRNAELDLEFYDLADILIGAVTFSTAGVFAFDQFHGFSSDVPIGRVVFRDVGHMVADDVYFGAAGQPSGLCHGLQPTITGTDGNDVIDGTDGPDVIAGLGGNDTIRGLGGVDVICGDAGHDVISGGHGDDLILGGTEGDRIAGNGGNDVIAGGDGNDTLHGGKGHDDIEGDHGDDVIDGGDGNDQCDGGPGRNRLSSCP